MRNSFVGLLALWLLSLHAPVSAFSVVPLSPMTSVDPSPAATEVPKGTGPALGDNSARLHGARGERGALQVLILPEQDKFLSNVRLEADIPGFHLLGAFRAWRIWNTFEVAVPLPPVGPALHIPSSIPLERASETRDQVRVWSLWLEYEIPVDATPGARQGELRVMTDSGTVVLPVEAEVYPFSMPTAPAFIVEMNSYGDYTRLLGKNVETFLELHRLFRRFRCVFTQVPYRQSGEVPQQYLAPHVTLDNSVAARVHPGNGEILDWQRFDTALAGLFDGSAFADNIPVNHFLMPFSHDWPVEGRLLASDAQLYRELNIRARREAIRHIQEKGWTGTVFQEFHNENPEHGSKAPWRLDEPRTEKDLAGHALFQGILARSRDGTSKEGSVLYRVDISDWRALGSGLESLAQGVEVWSVSEDRKYLDAAAAAFFADAAGEKGGFSLAYGELPGFVAGGVRTTPCQVVAPLLRAYSLGLDGYAQWMVDRWKDKDFGPGGPPPEAVPLYFSNAGGGRDLIYPGIWFGIEGPVPSLRLFAIREAQNLLDYGALALDRKLIDATELRQSLARPDLGTPAGFHALKERLASLLAHHDSLLKTAREHGQDRAFANSN